MLEAPHLQPRFGSLQLWARGTHQLQSGCPVNWYLLVLLAWHASALIATATPQ